MGKLFGLLGEKLGHSFSPLIHSYLGEYEYPLFEVAPDDLDSFMARRSFDGINVTIPYKQAVIPYCADLSEEARATGSVNTILKGEDGALHGHNTDCHGFRVMLERGGIDPNGKKALVLGDGGAARTVRAVLGELGAREITTISRRGENHYGNIERHFDAEIIINTTPVGMYPGNGCSPLPLEGFGRLAGVADLIYNPLRTKLLLDAGRAGIPCVNGLIMLVAQAEAASRLFMANPVSSANRNPTSPDPCPLFPVPSDAQRPGADAIHDSIFGKMQNIALIGMPGCGKTTVGRELAKIAGRPFADIDDLVAAAAGKSIPEIFAQGGEEAFRSLETHVLAEESRRSGAVIATGGGVVARPENLDLLRQNSVVVYMKRELSELATGGRPLSGSQGVAVLAQKRLPLYEAWCDRAVQVGPSPKVTAARIMEALRAMNNS